jgi:DNA polymerase-3 subunit epsilon/CBS domain-containing protein
MVVAGSATPLIGLDGVVLDSETTDLDPRKASIVEIALLPLTGGRLDTAAAVRSLVRPARPIPREATRIHGIDDAAVAGAPTFPQVWSTVSSRIGDNVVVGHSIGSRSSVFPGRSGPGCEAP